MGHNHRLTRSGAAQEPPVAAAPGHPWHFPITEIGRSGALLTETVPRKADSSPVFGCADKNPWALRAGPARLARLCSGEDAKKKSAVLPHPICVDHHPKKRDAALIMDPATSPQTWELDREPCGKSRS